MILLQQMILSRRGSAKVNIPRQVTRRRQGVPSGRRLNNKPTYIVVAIVGMTLFGIYYAAASRVSAPHSAGITQGDEMLSLIHI